MDTVSAKHSFQKNAFGEFSIAVIITRPSNNHSFVNFRSSHVRLQRFIFEIVSLKNIQKKKNRFFSKVHTRTPS